MVRTFQRNLGLPWGQGQVKSSLPNQQRCRWRCYDMYSFEAKIVVLGAQGVGKTSVVLRYIGEGFNNCVSPTIGAAFFSSRIVVGDCRLKLQLWDTAGQERFRAMAPMYYRRANAALLVYDITSLQSFADVKHWVLELKKNVETPLVMCVLGNKCDLQAQRCVSLQLAQEYATSVGARHFETSALSEEGIHEAFQYVAESLVKGFLVNTTDSLLESDAFAVRVNARILESKTNVEEEDREEPTSWCAC
ncbi:Ras-related protein Rab-21 [Lamellibrachia satsuma]|nr:Ras-related protein Rab-21 [Lamellibrachia satsuma]